jgi:DNA-binding FadR family transcriptional regulator
LRGAIEGYCSALLAREVDTPRAIRTMNILSENLGKQFTVCQTSHDAKEFSDLEYDFHLTIVRFSENTEFESIIVANNQKLHAVLQNFLTYPQRMETAYKEHVTLHGLITDNDPTGAYEYATMHILPSEYINLLES